MSKYMSILAMLLFLSCSFKQEIKSLQNGKCCTIDLDRKKEKRINLSSIFKENVKTIILETNRDCLIGELSEMQVYEVK